jgi:hypothetical protein
MLLDTSYQGQPNDDPTPRLAQLRADLTSSYPPVGPIWGGRSIDLGAGDSICFAANIRHGYANPGTTPCDYHVAAIITRPRHRHAVSG